MEIDSLNAFLDELSLKRGGKTATAFYRGHSSNKYKSLPKVFRNNGWKDAEGKLLRGVVEMHPEEFHSDLTTLEKLVRAQHFGLPTRLLDVTVNPLVALYFCCRENDQEDGSVLVYFFEDDRIKTFDSDTMSVIANASLLKDSEQTIINSLVTDHFSGKDRLTTSDFNRKSPLPRLLHFIRNEKPYFESRILPQTFRQYVAVLPKRNNRRMIAQSGAFIAFAHSGSLTASKSPKIEIETIKIPASAKLDLLRQLDGINVNQGALFPDVASAAEYLSGKYNCPF